MGHLTRGFTSSRCGLCSVWPLIAGLLMACENSATEPALRPLPALERVPFELLGGGKIVFERVAFEAGYSGIYIIDGASKTSTSGFNGKVTFGPSVSPDGRRLAFTRSAGNNTAYDVYVANLDGTAVQQLTRFPNQEGPPSWTPDGSKVVFTAFTPDIYVWNVYRQSPVPNAGDLVQLTSFSLGPGGMHTCPVILNNEVPVSVSSEGRLAFPCSREIYATASDGTKATSLYAAQDGMGVHSPVWSPDGRRLAFVEAIHDSATFRLLRVAVKVMNDDGSSVSSLATVAAGGFANLIGPNNFSLCWTADGSRILFSVPEDGLASHIWLVRTDGTGLTQVTSAPDVWDRSVSCTR